MPIMCSNLFKGCDATILGNPEEEVSGLAYRSDTVKPNDAFFCIVGLKVDGHSFAQDAIDRGARVIVAERRLYLADATDVTVVIVPDSRRAMADAACAFYGNPSRAFKLVGITGTNGKTTTTYLVESIAAHAGYTCGVIGTVGVKVDGHSKEAAHTTPESPDLQQIFATMRDAGCEVVSMEVSSHALDLERVWKTDFAVTAFTNLTQDHLDYHHTFDAYFEAKALLFGKDYPAKRVVCIDTQWGQVLAERVRSQGDDLITCGFTEDADIYPVSMEFAVKETRLELSVRGEKVALMSPLVGRFNVENIMVALASCLQIGIPLTTCLEALEKAPFVPGRLQRVESSDADDLAVYVDYAHTPDALEKALNSLSDLGAKKTIVVFGCGGDRDSAKRPIMGRVALAADHVYVTSDNPRTEDPDAIIADIVAGLKEADDASYDIIPDRHEAIQKAICDAEPHAVILIAGKGHEDYQIIGTEKRHFDDVEEVRAALELRAQRAADTPGKVD